MATKQPGYEERTKAITVVLSLLSIGSDIGQLRVAVLEMHRRNNLFPGEVLLELAADAIEESGATRSNPIDYEDIRAKYLPEVEFRGRQDHHKSHFALQAAAMIRGGLKPDLLGETYWWGTDNLWEHALYALIIYLRVAAERSD